MVATDLLTKGLSDRTFVAGELSISSLLVSGSRSALLSPECSEKVTLLLVLVVGLRLDSGVNSTGS